MTPTPTLPRRARNKLTSLQGIAADARDAASSAQRRISDLNFTLTAQELTAEDADSMREEIGRLQTVRDQQTARHAVFSAITTSVQQWMVGLPRGTSIEPAPPIDAKPRKGETPADAVKRVRQEIAELQSEWRAAKTAPQPKSVLKEQAKEQVRAFAERGRPRVVVDKGSLTIGFTPQSSFGFGDNRVAEIMAWLNEEAFTKRVLAEVDALPEPPLALTNEERDRLMQRLSGRMDALERMEEAFIEQAQQAGTEMLRRPDAGAPAILGVATQQRVRRVA
jgi:hypothetical protein